MDPKKWFLTSSDLKHFLVTSSPEDVVAKNQTTSVLKGRPSMDDLLRLKQGLIDPGKGSLEMRDEAGSVFLP